MRFRAVSCVALTAITAAGCATRPAARPPVPEEPLYVDELVPDPWERFNRRVYAFNATLDRRIVRPVAVAYDRVTPDPAQASIARFFANLRLPATALNQTLQGRPGDAGRSLGRFAINSTAGLAGMFDPAVRLGLSPGDAEDLGQTLARWGWADSRYLVLPLLGPATLRDAFGTAASGRLSPLHYVDDRTTSVALQLLQITDLRARLLPMDPDREAAHDEYALVRDVWAQRRSHRIADDADDGAR